MLLLMQLTILSGFCWPSSSQKHFWLRFNLVHVQSSKTPCDFLPFFLKDPGNIQYSLKNTNVLLDSVCSRALWVLRSLIMRCCSSSFVLISLSWSSKERHIFSRFACLHEEQKEKWLVVQHIICENLKYYEGKKNDSEAKISQLTDIYF